MPSEPGIVGRPWAPRSWRVPALLANRSRTLAGGPMNVSPWAATTSAKPSSSERKPYPGGMASHPVTSAAEITAEAERYERCDSAGPMQMASSARPTGSDSRSASLYATTDSTPRARHARRIRRAISPRLAIRTFLNIRARASRRIGRGWGTPLVNDGTSDGAAAVGRHRHAELDRDQVLPVLDRITGFDQTRADDPVDRRHDLLGHTEHVDGPETITRADAHPGGQILARLEDADRGRRRDASRFRADGRVRHRVGLSWRGCVAPLARPIRGPVRRAAIACRR